MPNTHSTLSELFAAIADAIRSKTGGSNSIKADDFPTAISEIPTNAGTQDATATADDIVAGITAYARGVKITGTIPSRNANSVTVSDNQVTIPKGNYPSQIQKTLGTAKGAQTYTPGTSDQVIAADQYLTGAQIIEGDENLVAANIRKNVTIFGVDGALDSEGGIDPSDATATENDIYPGKTAYIADGSKATGTMPTKSAETFTPGITDQVIQSGRYLTGNQTIKGDADLVPNNIKKDVDIFGVTGTYEGDNPLDPSDATATAGDILDGKTAYIADGSKAIGTISRKQADTIYPGTTDQTIPAGVYLAGLQTIKGDANLIAGNIKKNVSIFGVTGSLETEGGLDPSDATATENDILEGKTAYLADGSRAEGTIRKVTHNSPITPNTLDQVIPGGVYLNNNVTVKGDQNLRPENIKQGVTIFNVQGELENAQISQLNGVKLYGDNIKQIDDKITGFITVDDYFSPSILDNLPLELRLSKPFKICVCFEVDNIQNNSIRLFGGIDKTDDSSFRDYRWPILHYDVNSFVAVISFDGENIGQEIKIYTVGGYVGENPEFEFKANTKTWLELSWDGSQYQLHVWDETDLTGFVKSVQSYTHPYESSELDNYNWCFTYDGKTNIGFGTCLRNKYKYYNSGNLIIYPNDSYIIYQGALIWGNFPGIPGINSISRDGLLIEYDVKNNSGNGYNDISPILKDLSGNDNDAILSALNPSKSDGGNTKAFGSVVSYCGLQSFARGNGHAQIGQFNPDHITIEAFFTTPYRPTVDETDISIATHQFNTFIASNFRNGGYGLCWIYDRPGCVARINGIDYTLSGPDFGYQSYLVSDYGSRYRWHHIAMTYDGHILKLYIDGQLVDSKEVEGVLQAPKNNTQLMLYTRPTGSSPSSNSYENFVGALGYFRLYNRALTQPEIASHFYHDWYDRFYMWWYPNFYRLRTSYEQRYRMDVSIDSAYPQLIRGLPNKNECSFKVIATQNGEEIERSEAPTNLYPVTLSVYSHYGYDTIYTSGLFDKFGNQIDFASS